MHNAKTCELSTHHKLPEGMWRIDAQRTRFEAQALE